MKRIGLILFAVFFLGFIPGLYALEFGGILKADIDVAGQDETNTSGSIVIAPWVSVLFGEAELYACAGLNTIIGDETFAAPELIRLEFSSRLTPMISFRAGRITWQDPSRIVAQGRFDGADFHFDLGNINVGVNALYTGLLFKNSAEINVSPTDPKDYGAKLDWGDFGSTYSAPRRFLLSAYGEFPGYPSGKGQLYAGLLAQFDLSDADEAFHAQYLLLRHTLAFNKFDLDLAGAVEMENTKADGMRFGFAYSLKGGWQTPASITDRLSLCVAWASGEGDATAAFFPVTTEAQSFVLKPILSGMLIARVNYEARILPTLKAEIGGCYLVRTDSGSFTAPYLEDDSYPLGAELVAGFYWVPFSDLSVSLKGGAFLPQAGTAFADDAPVTWRVNIGTVFSF